MTVHHKDIVDGIKALSGSPTKHIVPETYLGNDHPRFPISNPELRQFARLWIKNNRDLSASDFVDLITDLTTGNTYTEKLLAGMLLDYATSEQRKFNPKVFELWLEHMQGWAEIDSLCTGNFTKKEIPANWDEWAPLLRKLARSKNISKRRASLVLLCSPISHTNLASMREVAFMNMDKLKGEREILITKAISWLLRSMIRHHRQAVISYLQQNRDTLPKIAVRETRTKLETGTKTKIRHR